MAVHPALRDIDALEAAVARRLESLFAAHGRRVLTIGRADADPLWPIDRFDRHIARWHGLDDGTPAVTEQLVTPKGTLSRWPLRTGWQSCTGAGPSRGQHQFSLVAALWGAPLPDRDHFLAECWRALEPGGVLIVMPHAAGSGHPDAWPLSPSVAEVASWLRGSTTGRTIGANQLPPAIPAGLHRLHHRLEIPAPEDQRRYLLITATKGAP